MNIYSIALIAFCSAVSLAHGPSAANRIPDLLYYEGSGDPLWVAAHTAVDENGEFRPELLGEEARTLLVDRKLRNRVLPVASAVRPLGQDEECTYQASPAIGDHETGSEGIETGLHDSLGALISDSVAIYQAVVLAEKPGFGGGDPGMLLLSKIERRYKESPTVAADEEALVFHDYARFAAGRNRLCVANEPLGVGDRFIIFIPHAPIDKDHKLLTGLIAIERPRGIGVSAQLAARGSLRGFETFSSVVAELARRLP